jgi:hypothetical protein
MESTGPVTQVPQQNGDALTLETNIEKPEETESSPAGNDEETESSEEDTESEEDEEDEEEDEDEEPALKYERIGGSLPDLLKKDSASALCISKSLMVPSSMQNLLVSDRDSGFGHAWGFRTHSRPHWCENQVL